MAKKGRILPRVSMSQRLETAALENRQLSVLLIALLRHTGPVTLSKAEAEVTWEGGNLHNEKNPDGSMRLWVEDLY